MTVALEDYYLYIAVLELDMQSVNDSDTGDQDQLQPENTNSSEISTNTVNDRLSAAAHILFSLLQVRRLFQPRIKTLRGI